MTLSGPEALSGWEVNINYSPTKKESPSNEFDSFGDASDSFISDQGIDDDLRVLAKKFAGAEESSGTGFDERDIAFEFPDRVSARRFQSAATRLLTVAARQRMIGTEFHVGASALFDPSEDSMKEFLENR